MEALRIIYNSEDTVITHTMLVELRDRLLAESSLYSAYHIWQNYKILDDEGSVDELDSKGKRECTDEPYTDRAVCIQENLKLTKPA